MLYYRLLYFYTVVDTFCVFSQALVIRLEFLVCILLIILVLLGTCRSVVCPRYVFSS